MDMKSPCDHGLETGVRYLHSLAEVHAGDHGRRLEAHRREQTIQKIVRLTGHHQSQERRLGRGGLGGQRQARGGLVLTW